MKNLSQNRPGREITPGAVPAGRRDRPASGTTPVIDTTISIPPTKQINITCDVGDFLPLDSIIDFQGEFKRHDQYDIENIIKSLVRYGINFPFFIWRDQGANYCLDGHGRKLALYQLRSRGYTIPDIPVVCIYAKDKAEAIQKLLRLNSRYGAITEDSVGNFIGSMPVDFGELSIPDINIIEFTDVPNYLDGIFSKEEAPPKEKPVKRCPYCGGILK
jgi:hypothetical protein